MRDGAHVLVARLDNAGDVLLTGPAVRAVAAGARRVTFLTSSTGAAAARLLPGVDEIVTFDAPWVAFDAPAVDRATFDATIERLAALGADQASDRHLLPPEPAAAWRSCCVSRACRSIAATSVDYPGTLLDVRHAVVDGHEVEQTLSLAATLGYHLPVDDDGALRLREPLPVVAPFLEPYVVVHPGASVPARGIPADLAGRRRRSARREWLEGGADRLDRRGGAHRTARGRTRRRRRWISPAGSIWPAWRACCVTPQPSCAATPGPPTSPPRWARRWCRCSRPSCRRTGGHHGGCRQSSSVTRACRARAVAPVAARCRSSTASPG